MNKIVIPVFIMLTIAFYACKKNVEDSHPQQLNTLSIRKQIIMKDSWIFRDIDYNGMSVFGSTKDCDKDDVYYFNSNDSAVINEGKTKCDPNSPQVNYSTWKFLDDETRLIFLGDTLDIDVLSSDSLKYSLPAPGGRLAFFYSRK
ncbi:MAG: hypothetical protein H7321_05950 [Bacteroidia bacterium]|nr:hypothetical protein [Bacteroidia bacterium]